MRGLSCSVEEFIAGPGAVPPLVAFEAELGAMAPPRVRWRRWPRNRLAGHTYWRGAATRLKRHAQRDADMLGSFRKACHGAAEGAAVAAAAASAGHTYRRGAATRLKRQAQRDADMLLLAEWWNELVGKHVAINELLFGARTELRLAAPSHSLARAQVNAAAQQYLRLAKDATAVAHADLLAAQRCTDGPRVAVLDHVLRAAAADRNLALNTRPQTWFGCFEETPVRVERRELQHVAEAVPAASEPAVHQQPQAVPEAAISDLQRLAQRLPTSAEWVLAQPQDATPERDSVAESSHVQQDEHVREPEPLRDVQPAPAWEWYPTADLNSQPAHVTLDAQQRLVPTVPNTDLQNNPLQTTMKAAPRITDEVGGQHVRVLGEPLSYVEELAVPPAWAWTHTDRQGLRQHQDDGWGEGQSEDEQQERERDEYEDGEGWSPRAPEGGHLTIHVWAEATLLDC